MIFSLLFQSILHILLITSSIYIFSIIPKPIEKDLKNELLIEYVKKNPYEFYEYNKNYDLPIEVLNDIIKTSYFFPESFHLDLKDVNLFDCIDEKYYSPKYLLIILHSKPNLILQVNNNKDYPIHYAIKNNINIHIIKELLFQGRILEKNHNITIETHKNIDGKNVFDLLLEYNYYY